MIEIISILSGILVGFSLGLTGGGGSVFAVPLLVYVVGLDVHLALGTSLASVGITSLFGSISSIYHKQADLRVGVIFGLCAVFGTYFGTRVNGLLEGSMLLLLFSCLMLFMGIKMWRRSTPPAGPSAEAEAGFSIYVLILAGIGTGVASGLFGIGGGFLIVPALLFIARLDIHRAVATSLCIIAANGMAGMASYAIQGREIDYMITGWFTLGGVLGIQGGKKLGKRLDQGLLMKVFAVVIIGIAGFVIAENI
jgi:uncharacterized protein